MYSQSPSRQRNKDPEASSNDSLNSCGSHKDRHAKIGEGQIGLDAIVRIINHDALKNLPFLLETPNELDGYAKEIELLKSKYIW